MRKLIGLVALLASLSVGTAHAAKPESHTWTGWNAEPFATSQSDACNRAKQAIDGFKQMPTPVKAHFIAELGTTCAGPEDDVWLTPSMRRVEMWDKHRPLQNVTVGELPVLKSPDGRPFRKRAVADTAHAKQWTYAYEGKGYVLNLPYVCFNWTWGFGPPVQVKVVRVPPVVTTITKTVTKLVAPPPEPCVRVVFNAPVRWDIRWNVGGHKALPPSICNAMGQGDEPLTAWGGQCDNCEPALWVVKKTIGEDADIYHRFKYRARYQRQTLSFSRDVWLAGLSICLEDPMTGKSYCAVHIVPDGTSQNIAQWLPLTVSEWHAQLNVVILDSAWLAPSNCLYEP